MHRGSAGEVFRVFLGLGLTSFGGPVAHIGYFQDAFVARRRWLGAGDYADLVALCQILPGPSSSQVGFGIGMMRAGPLGALAAWAGFTLPSTLLLVMLGYGVLTLGDRIPPGVLEGLKIAAVAVVVQAIWSMARSLTPDRARITIAALSAMALLLVPGPVMQVAVIALAGITGLLVADVSARAPASSRALGIGHGAAVAALSLFVVLLFGLPLLAAFMPSQTLALVDAFYRAGALVFGGGHVVLPLLQGEVVSSGWVTDDLFMAGYGAAQAVPGPLFTFAAYLGTVAAPAPHGLTGAMICLLAIFAPSFLLLIGILPFWEGLRSQRWMRGVLWGVNAAVVGLLLAALYDPVWTSAIKAPSDAALAGGAVLLLMAWRVPPWLLVILCMGGGRALAAVV